MTPKKLKSEPRHQVTLHISDEIIDRAIRADSGGCVIADAIKAQVPNATAVTVDLATIRFSDKPAGKRYIYLTPDAAQLCVFAFDRGLRPAAQKLTLTRPIQIATIKAASNLDLAQRRARRAELEAKDPLTLTSRERSSLTRLRQSAERPATGGPKKIDQHGTITGGDPLPTTPGATPAERGARSGAIPELLPARARVFGARKANASKLDELLDQARAEGRGE